ncbi:MAG: MaoC family dehydratase, partial [Myxococcales bacterium]|nr:MaoC family dehydratase [Myxococcales bacterium]
RMASSVITTETKNSRGELVAETEWQILYRFDGGFGGPPPPRTARIRVPERDADFRIEETTSPEQALLYRLSGDWNPLHADPAIGEAAGFGGPILHGLCTYGYVGRAVLGAVCGGDISRFRSLSGQFRKPVWPGETLITEGWVDGSQVFLRVATRERPTEYVFSNAVAEVSE